MAFQGNWYDLEYLLKARQKDLLAEAAREHLLKMSKSHSLKTSGWAKQWLGRQLVGWHYRLRDLFRPRDDFCSTTWICKGD